MFRAAFIVILLVCTTRVQPVFGVPTKVNLTDGTADQATMSFVGADIESVIKAIGQYTNTTFIIDPRVKGTINLVSEMPIGKNQAFDLLASTLRLQGYTVVRGDGFVKVVPEADAKLQVASTRETSVRGDQIATQIFTLNYESAANILPVLRPLISPNNTINANPGNNTLVVTDYAENLRRLGKMIAALDVPAASDMDIVPIRYAIASDVAVLLSKMLDSGGTTGTNPSDSTRTMILADPRTNSLLIRAPSIGRANLAKSLIAKLDQATTSAGNIHVVYLKNADAVNLAKTLRSITSFDTSTLTSESSGRASSGKMLQSSSTGNSGGMSQTSGAGASDATASNSAPSEKSLSSSGGSAAGFIQADRTTNTLIITASDPVYRNLRSVIDQLDTQIAQVHVEALIVAVTDSAASEIGVQWAALSGDKNSSYRRFAGTGFTGNQTGVNPTNPSANLLSAGIASAFKNNSGTPTTIGGGMQIGIIRQIAGQIGLGALASALNGTNGGNVLSLPSLTVEDNHEAKMLDGKNVPVTSGSQLQVGNANSVPFNTVDRKDVGTALKITPHILSGGTMRLEIAQEVSSVDSVSAAATQNLGPTFTTRSMNTTVVVNDGDIVALGGLIQDNHQSNVQKVPWLGDIPLIGNFFKYQSASRDKTTLMIFLRPSIIRSQQDNDAVVASRYDYLRTAQIKVQPDKSILTDFGSSVLPRLEDGGPFIDLRKSLNSKETPSSSTVAPTQDLLNNKLE
ncbi:General secretion pathway protein D [Collimonas arenae]|uniref:General secretion pathway protein D n=2 Tax=Collimonas arenae TaxID=279058 RepID=A0A0A1FCS5_9BURK|nr:General secretion pathway protein D [Collimonas arenae]